MSVLTRAIDVMPTILAVANVASNHDEMQGRVLAPLWNGTEAAGRRIAFIESAVTPWEVKSMRTATHKLVIHIDQ